LQSFQFFIQQFLRNTKQKIDVRIKGPVVYSTLFGYKLFSPIIIIRCWRAVENNWHLWWSYDFVLCFTILSHIFTWTIRYISGLLYVISLMGLGKVCYRSLQKAQLCVTLQWHLTCNGFR
jgi:hypothetical protein